MLVIRCAVNVHMNAWPTLHPRHTRCAEVQEGTQGRCEGWKGSGRCTYGMRRYVYRGSVDVCVERVCVNGGEVWRCGGACVCGGD
jgi:hypothetical protein